MQLTSTLTCPHCGHRSSETMPTEACQFFYECTACGTVLRPEEGDSASPFGYDADGWSGSTSQVPTRLQQPLGISTAPAT